MESTRIGIDDVGGGINCLACAAIPPRSGRDVRVLERESVLSGCIRTDELTLPGMRRDTLSTSRHTNRERFDRRRWQRWSPFRWRRSACRRFLWRPLRATTRHTWAVYGTSAPPAST